MQAQKRIKTQGYQIHQISDKKQLKQKLQKSSNITRPHKQSQAHLKSISKDITPKKHSITVQRSKYKQANSNKKPFKSKQLTSVCSYSAMDKESIPATKRKGSNARSVNGNAKKKYSKNRQQINESLKSTVSNFSVLTKCLTEFIKEEKKKGKDPSVQILHLIKAFNKSEVAPLSKQLQILINNMLDYIEGTVGLTNQDERDGARNQKTMKSRSSFSSASDRQINSHIPTTLKKQKQTRPDTNQLKKHSKSQFTNDKNRRTYQSNFSQQQSQQINEDIEKDNENQQNPRFQRSVSKLNKQLQQELKHDLQSMHEQLYQLKSAGQKLQNKKQNRGEDRKKLEEIYRKNKQLIESISQKNSEVLKNKRTQVQQHQYSEEEQDQH